MAVPAGLEPATRGVEIRYSIQLSYGTVSCRPLGRLLWRGLAAFYHGKYEKSAGSPSLNRTVFPPKATKRSGGVRLAGLSRRGGEPCHTQESGSALSVHLSGAAVSLRRPWGSFGLALPWRMRTFAPLVPSP